MNGSGAGWCTSPSAGPARIRPPKAGEHGRNIPLSVWAYHIGGYHVIRKWLSYRQQKRHRASRCLSSYPQGDSNPCLQDENLIS